MSADGRGRGLIPLGSGRTIRRRLWALRHGPTRHPFAARTLLDFSFVEFLGVPVLELPRHLNITDCYTTNMFSNPTPGRSTFRARALINLTYSGLRTLVSRVCLGTGRRGEGACGQRRLGLSRQGATKEMIADLPLTPFSPEVFDEPGRPASMPAPSLPPPFSLPRLLDLACPSLRQSLLGHLGMIPG